MKPLAVKLYTRRSCPLCDEFTDALEAGFPRMLDIAVCNVDEESRWQQQFGNDVPVLTHVDGGLICQHHLDPDAVRRALNRAVAGS